MTTHPIVRLPLLEEHDVPTEQHVRDLHDVALNRGVGASHEYSNANFVILGLLIETVSGQRYGDYVQHHIFDPLDMLHSYTSHAEGRANGIRTDIWGRVRQPARNVMLGMK